MRGVRIGLPAQRPDWSRFRRETNRTGDASLIRVHIIGCATADRTLKRMARRPMLPLDPETWWDLRQRLRMLPAKSGRGQANKASNI